MTAALVVERIADLFDTRGTAAYLGEQVSMREHMLQAAHAAQCAGAAEPLVVAALLHDVGHFLHGFDEDAADRGIDTGHEHAGADWLASWFAEPVCEPIRLHVAAKRYLCATDSDYLAVLSPASVHSLELQGGAFSAAESERFAALAYASAAVDVRRWDDAGKCPGMPVPTFEHFRPLLERAVIAGRRR